MTTTRYSFKGKFLEAAISLMILLRPLTARSLSILLGFMLITISPDYSSAVEQPAITDRISLAAKLSQQGRHEEAIQIMNTIIESDSTDSDAYFWRGLFKLEQNKNIAAINDFNQSIFLEKKHFSSHLFRAYAHGRAKDYKNAISDWKAVIRLDPTNSQNYNGEAYWMIDASHNIQMEIDLERSCDLLKKAKELGYTKEFTNKTMREFC